VRDGRDGVGNILPDMPVAMTRCGREGDVRHNGLGVMAVWSGQELDALHYTIVADLRIFSVPCRSSTMPRRVAGTGPARTKSHQSP
jgi:hypothetical protein